MIEAALAFAVVVLIALGISIAALVSIGLLAFVASIIPNREEPAHKKGKEK